MVGQSTENLQVQPTLEKPNLVISNEPLKQLTFQDTKIKFKKKKSHLKLHKKNSNYLTTNFDS